MKKKKKLKFKPFKYKGCTVRMSSQEKVESLNKYVNRILEALGFDPDDVIVSDESLVWDFGLEDEQVKEASEKLGMPMTNNDRIWAVANSLMTKDHQG